LIVLPHLLKHRCIEPLKHDGTLPEDFAQNLEEFCQRTRWVTIEADDRSSTILVLKNIEAGTEGPSPRGEVYSLFTLYSDVDWLDLVSEGTWISI
jgi:hypothetical protein